MRFYLSIWLFFICFGISRATELPRVIITTDINAGRGDPDDRQSLCHLLWYANTLDIRGIIPDRFSPSAIEACTLALDCYQKDFNAPKTKFRELNFPAPESVREDILIRTRKDAIATIIQEASREDDRPLWILAWGN